MSNPYAKYFEQKRVFGMLHLKGESIPQVLECLKKEFDEYVKGGIDGVVVENYYNGCDEIIAALDYLHDQIGSQTLIGVNCLRSESMGLELAAAYKTDFVQLDSVVGHVIPRDDATLTHFFKIWQEKYTGMILGGVRFKKQPLLSENPLSEDLKIAQSRCHAVCVTQAATGEETHLDKIISFREGLKDFPLLISAGATPTNVKKSFSYINGVIAGSYFKDTYEVSGTVCSEHVRELVRAVKEGEVN